jgi:hypothetical protein
MKRSEFITYVYDEGQKAESLEKLAEKIASRFTLLGIQWEEELEILPIGTCPVEAAYLQDKR